MFANVAIFSYLCQTNYNKNVKDMNRYVLFFALILMTMVQNVSAQDLNATDVENSDCLSHTRAAGDNQEPTIVLTKDGSILSVQLLNYRSNCGTKDFNIMPGISDDGNGNPCSVSIDVVPVIPAEKDCWCPFNISFTIHNLELNVFYLKCWWYEGLVELTDGETLSLEYKHESAIYGISDIDYSSVAPMTIYDLQGRRLTDKPTKGIYIQNGKKVVIK